MGHEVDTGKSGASAAQLATWQATKLGRGKSIFLLAFPVILLGYVFAAASGTFSLAEHRKPEPVIAADLQPNHLNGGKIYRDNCAKCHGVRGHADGETSASLDPWARKFGEEKFQFSSTENGVPTDDDLKYIVSHGIPGTAMPSFENLNPDQVRALIAHVRLLTFAGMYARLYKRAAKDEDPEPAEIHKQAVKLLTPGPIREVPSDLPPSSPESIERGRKIFITGCATCHGPMGAGDGPQVKGMKRDNGQPIRPRDLSRGIFMGGGEPHRLYVRIALGMPGTPMPASATLKPSEIGDLVNFVLSLSANRPKDLPN